VKLSQRLQDEKAFVEQTLADSVICSRCGATLATYADVCSAPITESCPGFDAIEDVRQKFAKQSREAPHG
jgi:ribosomal protein L40E